MANVLISETGALKDFDATDLLEGETTGGTSFHGTAQSIADLVTVPISLAGAGDTFTATGAAPGEYTLAKSGIVVKNDDGDEIFRIWGTDPDDNNFNSGNLYVGLRAGANATTNNEDSGYYNVGIGMDAMLTPTTGHTNSAVGVFALSSLLTGNFNSAFGGSALLSVVSSSYNSALGESALRYTLGEGNTGTGNEALYYNEGGANNTAVGRGAGYSAANTDPDMRSVVDVDMIFIGRNATRGGVSNETPLTNGIAIGVDAVVTSSNAAVIGNADVTDIYFGSESAAAIIHAAGYAVGATAGIDATVDSTSIATTTYTFTKGLLTAAV